MAGEKILVVDDERIVRDTFDAIFDEYKIVPANSGQQALNILNHSNDIDLVVLDVMMPGLRGIELLKEVKKIKPDIKVIILTGYNSKNGIIKTLRPEVNEIIEKPFDVEKLKRVFKKLLSKPH